MNEFKPVFELVPDQTALDLAWKDLASALVLKADTIAPLEHQLPLSGSAPHPYLFRQDLKGAAAARLLEDDSSTIKDAFAEYTMPHKYGESSDEAYESVAIDWIEHAQGSPIVIGRSVTITKVHEAGQEYFEAYSHTEYTLYDTGERITRSGAELFEDGVTDADIYLDMTDREEDRDTFTLNDLEKVHDIANRLRQPSKR